MSALDLEKYVNENPLFAGLSKEQLHRVFDGAHEEYFAKDRFMFRQEGEASSFYLIREGKVSLEASAPGRPPITLQTLGPGDVLGWSWMLPPHTWNFDARALETTLAVTMDGENLLKLVREDDKLGNLLTHRFLRVVVQRLQAARVQLLDLYAQKA